MSRPLTSSAVALVRTWTWLYTSRLPPFLRDGRRQEIDSDLWEYCRDRHAGTDSRIAAEIVVRLLLGIGDDLLWRIEHRHFWSPLRIRSLVAATMVVALLGGIWSYTAALLDDAPPLPPPPHVMFFVAAPPPPPPPPPPPRVATVSDSWRPE
jgi:hypothetical protein